MILLLSLIGVLAGGCWGWRRMQRERELFQKKRALRLLLQHLTHALRVGVGFQQALERAVQDADGVLSVEWRRLYQHLQIGRPLKEALADLAERVPMRETRWFATAVTVSQQTGGSLAGILEILIDTLREREALRDRIDALTAQGKASAVILGVLPLVLLIALQVIAPDMVQPLFSTATGQGLIAAALVLVACGALVMQHIIRMPEN